MPQASDELRAIFEDDAEALDALRENFTNTRGILRRKDKSYTPSQREFNAIDYLFHEWDYEYHID